jgi:hypothetical protein
MGNCLLVYILLYCTVRPSTKVGIKMPEKCCKCKDKLCHLCWFWWNDDACEVIGNVKEEDE